MKKVFSWRKFSKPTGAHWDKEAKCDHGWTVVIARLLFSHSAQSITRQSCNFYNPHLLLGPPFYVPIWRTLVKLSAFSHYNEISNCSAALGLTRRCETINNHRTAFWWPGTRWDLNLEPVSAHSCHYTTLTTVFMVVIHIELITCGQANEV